MMDVAIPVDELSPPASSCGKVLSPELTVSGRRGSCGLRGVRIVNSGATARTYALVRSILVFLLRRGSDRAIIAATPERRRCIS